MSLHQAVPTVAGRPVRIGYGAVRLAPDPIDSSRRFFRVFDHAAGGLLGAWVDGVGLANCQLIEQRDATGRAIAVLELGQPLGELEALEVEAIGYHPAAAATARDAPAAAVLGHFLSTVCGLELGALAELAAACTARGVRLAGLIDERYASRRAVIDALCVSMGARWALGMPEFARLDAWQAVGIVRAALRVDSETECRYLADDTATRVTVRYAWDYVADAPRESVTYAAAADHIAAHGDKSAVIDALFVADANQAGALAARALAELARPLWSVTGRLEGELHAAAPARLGDAVEVVDAALPIQGAHPLVWRRESLSTGAVTGTVQARVGADPRGALVGRWYRGVGDAPEFSVERVDGTVRVTTEPGARVTLGTVTRVAGADGVAVFTAPPAGEYDLVIAAPGFQAARVLRWAL